MILLCIFVILALVMIAIGLTLAGSVIVILLDPIIFVITIMLIAKLIGYCRDRFKR